MFREERPARGSWVSGVMFSSVVRSSGSWRRSLAEEASAGPAADRWRGKASRLLGAWPRSGARGPPTKGDWRSAGPKSGWELTPIADQQSARGTCVASRRAIGPRIGRPGAGHTRPRRVVLRRRRRLFSSRESTRPREGPNVGESRPWAAPTPRRPGSHAPPNNAENPWKSEGLGPPRSSTHLRLGGWVARELDGDRARGLGSRLVPLLRDAGDSSRHAVPRLAVSRGRVSSGAPTLPVARDCPFFPPVQDPELRMPTMSLAVDR